MVWTTARVRTNSQHHYSNTQIVSWWQNSKGEGLRFGNGISLKDGVALLKVNTPIMMLANVYRTNRLQDAQSLNNARKQVALIFGSLFLFGAYFNCEPQPERNPDLFSTFETALLKANYIFLVGVLCSDTLAPLF